MEAARELGNLIDPLVDLGKFDNRAMRFKESVSSLVSPHTGEPYNAYWQKEIEGLREIYILYQKAMQSELNGLSERRGYIADEDKKRFHEEVQLLIELGFRFSDIAQLTGYSEKYLRNTLKLSDYFQTHTPMYFSKRLHHLQPDTFFFPQMVEDSTHIRRGRSALERTVNRRNEKRKRKEEETCQKHQDNQSHNPQLFLF